MTVNQEAFRDIHGLITEFPELHNQNTWEDDPATTGHCGTTRCAAGWATWVAARNAGLLTRKRQMTDHTVREELAVLLGITGENTEDDPYYSGYCHTDYPVIGGTVLGLTGEQATSLFHDYNHDRVAARIKSFAETGEDLSDEEREAYDNV